jgi:hypothetical protein
MHVHPLLADRRIQHTVRLRPETMSFTSSIGSDACADAACKIVSLSSLTGMSKELTWTRP